MRIPKYAFSSSSSVSGNDLALCQGLGLEDYQYNV